MDAERTLIILLAVTLTVFLIVAIVFLVNLIKISRNVNSVAEKMDDAAGNVAAASQAFKNLATPLAITTLLGKIFKSAVKSKKRRSRKDE
jgi:uncharacterized protein YoxC